MPKPRCPEFIWNTLEVSGPKDAIDDFLNAAAGPGFIDWRPDWYSLYEYTYFLLMRAKQTAQEAELSEAAARITHESADALAQKLRDRLWRLYERRRTAAEGDPTGCPFDLNALLPIPAAVLERGGEAVADWMGANWGTRSAPWRVSCGTALRRAGEGVRQVYAFTFLTEDWSPWIAIAKLRERWPTLEIALRPRYLEDVQPSSPEPRTGGKERQPGNARRRLPPIAPKRRDRQPRNRYRMTVTPV
jgi:hypothetical protein